MLNGYLPPVFRRYADVSLLFRSTSSTLKVLKQQCYGYLSCAFSLAWLGQSYVALQTDKAFLAADPNLGPGCAPQILILFIDMFLMANSKPVEEECDAYMFNGQRAVQIGLVLIALACIPVLLLGTPLYLNQVNKKKREKTNKKVSNFRRYQNRDSETMEEEVLPEAETSHSFSELMIHQAVHTIEFVLSTISHTASYLRLWALSLAHAQLSEMLWNMVLSRLALQDHSMIGVPKLFVVFTIWAMFSMSILVVMEGLSAFLHTLRLHWVEFMSKFYTGGGYPFKPFSFKVLLSADSDKADNFCKTKERKKHAAEGAKKT